MSRTALKPSAHLTAALSYAARNWRVFPLHTARDGKCSCRKDACDSPGKHPRNANGCTGATTDTQQVTTWWTQWPDANVGIATGQGLVVIDIDPRHGGDESLGALEAAHGALPDTPRVLTGGGGQHLYFASATPVRNSAGQLGNGIDVRGEGGYVVAPPSAHVSGRPYVWDLGADASLPLATLPSWVPARTPERASSSQPAADAVIEGGRNSYLASVAGSMLRRGMSESAIVAAILAENAAKCRPPLDEKEAEKIATGIARRYPPGTSPATAADSSRFLHGSHAEMGDRLVSILTTGANTAHAEGNFWRCRNGIWETLDDDDLTAMVIQFDGQPVGDSGKKHITLNAGAAASVIRYARAILRTAHPTLDFAHAPRGVAVRNGFVRVTNGTITLEPLIPEHCARHRLDCEYVPGGTEAVEAFIAELFADVTEAESHARAATLQEFIGACLVGDAPKYQRAMVLYGPGGNGKSELLNAVRALFPKHARASLSPQDWGKPFRLSMLHGTRVNLVNEMPSRDILEGDVFKAVVTGDEVVTERKFKDPMHFVPEAGHVFAGNILPGVGDATDGFWRRILVVPLSREFEASSERRLEAGHTLATQHLGALLSWALEGAAAMQRAGAYTIGDSSREIAAEWRDESDPVRAWIREARWPGAVAAMTLYEQYKAWAAQRGFGTMSVHTFGRRLVASRLVARRKAHGTHVYECISGMMGSFSGSF